MIGIDRPNGVNLLPLDVARHQATIKNPPLINAEDDATIVSTPAETLHEKGNAGQPREAKPFHEGNGHGKARCRCGKWPYAGDFGDASVPSAIKTDCATAAHAAR